MDYISLGSRYLKSYLDSKKVRRALIVLVIVGVGCGGFYINRYFKNNRQQEAIAAFNEAMQTYMTALVADLDFSKNGQKAAWDEVDLAFQTAYDQHDRADFAPFLLIYKAQALAGQQNYQQASDLVGQALASLPVSSPFYDLYAIMQAALMIDAGNTAGFEQLKKLANDTSSDYAAMAQYYLAQYYLAQNQPDQAQAIFNKLALQDSSWSLLAKDYI